MPGKYCKPCRSFNRCGYDRCASYRSRDNYCRFPMSYRQPQPPAPPGPPPIGQEAFLVLTGEYDGVNVNFILANAGQITAENTVVTIVSAPGQVIDPADIVVSQGTVSVVGDIITWNVGTLTVGPTPTISFPQEQLDVPIDFTGTATTSSLNNPSQNTTTVTVPPTGGGGGLVIEAIWQGPPDNFVTALITTEADTSDLLVTITPDPDLVLNPADIVVVINGAISGIIPVIDPITGEITINVGEFLVGDELIIFFPQTDPAPGTQSWAFNLVTSNLDPVSIDLVIE